MPKMPTLYHGTDARLVNMSKDERNSYLNHCKVVTDFLWTIFKPFMEKEDYLDTYNGVECICRRHKIERYMNSYIEKFGKNAWYNMFEKLQMLGFRDDGNEQYQYKSFYLTFNRHIAQKFARRSFAGGEQGLIAYYLITALENLGWDNDVTPIKSSIVIIKSFANGKAQPVIIPFDNLDLDFLQTEAGRPLNRDWDYSELQINVRYTKECEMSLQKAEYL